MGQSAGGGEPLNFQCAKCRRRNSRDICVTEGHAVTLTGRKRARMSRGLQVGRHGHVSREYKCSDCGHVGWSRHNDLERTERRQAAREVSDDPSA